MIAVHAKGKVLIPLTQVPDLPFMPRRRSGRKISKATAFRWAKVGVGPGKVRLATVQAGGAKCTTKAMLVEFFTALAAAKSDAGAKAAAASIVDRKAAQSAADTERELRNNGF